MGDTVFLIDTFSLMFQVFHGIPPMTSPTGMPTNAVFGFSRDLVTLLQVHRPTWLICALESQGLGKREELYPEYKANRSEMPEDLRPQIELIIETIGAFGVPVVNAQGWEADDVIATLTRQAVERGHHVRIVTSDKDARQLLGPQVQILNLRKNTTLDEAALMSDWGVRPNQVVDFQALVGDAVDNVPGVPLVGPKKASALLQQFETLEGVLANADKAPGAKLKENLKTFADQARLSQTLVRLNQHLELDFDWEQSRSPQPDVPGLQALFRKFGFRKLIDDVQQFQPKDRVISRDEVSPTRSQKAAPTSRSGQRSLFGDDDEDFAAPSASSKVVPPATVNSGGSITPQSIEQVSGEVSPLREPTEHARQQNNERPIPRQWTTIDSIEKFADFLEQLKRQSRICLDLETTGLDPRTSRIVGWAFCWEAGSSFYVPNLGPAGSQLLDSSYTIESFKPILENSNLRLVNQNLKFDLMVMQTHGISVNPNSIDMDPMVGDYLLDAGARSHSLDTLIQKYLGAKGIPISDLIGSGKTQVTMAEVPVERIAEYASEDADLTLRIANHIARELHAIGLWDLYWHLERPLIPILAEMEQTGIRVDADELRQQSKDLTHRLDQLMSEIYELAGHEFNIDSPKQLQVVLFDELKLPVKRKTKSGASTDQEVLEELAILHPLPAKITEHRHLSKLRGTYLDSLPLMINSQTGRIHTSFNQVVAATGRLSSSDPNLQNIPIRTPEGERIRRAFIPQDSNWRIVCADYSQIELRVLAHFSQDRELIAAFEAGIDIHTAVAAQVFGVDREAISSDQRRMAKAVNFGVIYGQSPFGLAAALGIPREEASAFISEYFTKYAGVSEFIEKTLDEVLRSGFARTILGRRRPIDGIRAKRTGNLSMPERTAVNSVIQGSAADLIKRAMLAVRSRLRKDDHPARMLLQIHDELVFETPTSHVQSLVELVRHEMQSAMKLSVPLIVDVSVGENWLDTHPVDA